MFQSYDDENIAHLSGSRLDALRAEMANMGIDGFLVPRCDEFQGEYVAAYAERLSWLTGFSGSAGLAVILAETAAIFVDGRYTLQVAEQIDTAYITAKHLIDEPPIEWLVQVMKKSQTIGYDPWLMTAGEIKKYRAALAKVGVALKAVTQNPVDAVWLDQPSRPVGMVAVQPSQFSGQPVTEKLPKLWTEINKFGVDSVVLSLPDSIAWLFNIRGSDVAHTPVMHGFAIVPNQGRATLFVDRDKLNDDVLGHLDMVADIVAPEDFSASLIALGKGHKVLIDPASISDAVEVALKQGGAEIIHGGDPCILPKACKNVQELDGARAAHIRDGAAMAEFLYWLEETAPGDLDEVEVAQKLEEFRSADGLLKDISFDTISGAGPHAAIPHYKVNHASSRKLSKNEIYLIDSGGQYQDGTTDITRTVIIGKPTKQMKDRFTRVLKGMISLTLAQFPTGTTGGNLDCLARLPLWQAGLDFDHGTGHGVGSYLSVHEGPARFSKADKTVLQPGMILSNEPGYYKADDYGIRIENLLIVREGRDVADGERAMLWFETVTLAPIDRRLIDEDLLSPEELRWLNAYHKRVEKEIAPLVSERVAKWLKQVCAAL